MTRTWGGRLGAAVVLVVGAAWVAGCTGGGATDAGSGGGAGGGTGGGAGGGTGGGSGAVATVELSPATVALRVGMTQQLTATVKDAAGTTLTGQALTWTSSAPTIASVDLAGVVTALAPGPASVTATAGGVTSAAVSVTVSPAGSFVGPGGGVLEFLGGAVKMDFPAGAVAMETAITVGVSTVTPPSYPATLPGTRYDFGPEGITFAQPVKVTVRYDPMEVPAGVPPAWLQLAKLAGLSWEPVASQVDTTAHTVTGDVTGFSPWGVTAFPGQLKRLRFPDNGDKSRFFARDVAVDAQGNTVVVGDSQDSVETSKPVAGGRDVLVASYGASLRPTWVRQLGSDGVDDAWRVAVTPTGVIGVSGTTTGAWGGTAPANGSASWVTTLTPGGQTRTGWPVQQDVMPNLNDSVFDLVGNPLEEFFSLLAYPGAPAVRVALASWTGSGAPPAVAPVGFGAPATIATSGVGLATSSLGTFVLAQTNALSTPVPEWKGWALAGLAANGTPLSGFPLHQGETETGSPQALTSDVQSNVFVASFTDSSSSRLRVSCFTSGGTPRSGWPVEFDVPADTSVKSMAVDATGNVYLAGKTEGTLGAANAGGADVFVTSFAPSGQLRAGWPVQLGTAGDDEVWSMVVDAQGAVVVLGRLDAGAAESTPEGREWFLARLFPN